VTWLLELRLIGRPSPTKVETREFDYRLRYLNCDAVNFLRIRVNRQSALKCYLAPLGDYFESSLAESVGDRGQLQPIKTAVKPSLL